MIRGLGSISIDEVCRNCVFYDFMVCRKHSPSTYYNGKAFMTEFPSTYPDGWCGDWEFQEDVSKRLENGRG